jgi:hypothetical protein
MPWNTDWTKPFYEVSYAPGKGRFPDKFSEMSDDTVQKWDALFKTGELLKVEFPDRSALYLSPGLTKEDQTLLAKLFWDQRWSRYFGKVWPWLAGAVLPAFSLLIFGLAFGWIVRGFKKQKA